MGFFEIDNNFILPNGFDPGMLDDLPIHKHVYGQPMERIPTKLYWTEYQPWQPGDGTISFARWLCIEYPEAALHVRNYMQEFFPSIKFIVERVGLLKTNGRIRSHIDESSRKCCINIGIKNSSGAITRTSDVTDKVQYLDSSTDYVCQDRYAYLLDTGNRHEVIPVNTNPRYMFTYGFDISFETVRSSYKSKTI